MRIQIREKDGVHLTLLFPTAVVAGLLGSRLAAKLISKAVGKMSSAGAEALPEMTGEEVSGKQDGVRDAFRRHAVMQVQSALQPQTIRKIQKELKKCLWRNRRLTLVEVESADGDYVKIVL